MTIPRSMRAVFALFILMLGLAACGNLNPGDAGNPTPTTDPGAAAPTPESETTPEEVPPVNGESDEMFDLTGTSWIVENVTSANESTIPAIPVTIEFNADGSFGGSDGCNLYDGGQYRQEGDILTVDLAVTPLTERPCDQATTETAERFFTVLGGSHQVSMSEGMLVLTREDGSSIRLVQGEAGGAASGAAGGTMPAAQPLDGTQWLLVGYGQDGATQPMGELTLTFANAQMSGFAGCNSFSAPYEVDGERLVIIGDILSTLMACQDNAMNEQERALLDALASVTTFTRDSNTLVLDYEGGTLQYAAMETDATALENQTWTLSTMLIGGDAAVAPNPDAPVTMTIQDGRITGNTGCNEFFTDYTVEGSQLSLGAVGSTRRACPEEVAPQEQQFLELFRAVNGFRLEGPQLTLLTDGTPALVFTVPEVMP